MILKPCPFCGRSASLLRLGDHSRSTRYTCDWCGCYLETGEEWDHGRQWNEREGERAALTRALVAQAWAVACAACVNIADQQHANDGNYARVMVAALPAPADLAAEILGETTTPGGG